MISETAAGWRLEVEPVDRSTGRHVWRVFTEAGDNFGPIEYITGYARTHEAALARARAVLALEVTGAANSFAMGAGRQTVAVRTHPQNLPPRRLDR